MKLLIRGTLTRPAPRTTTSNPPFVEPLSMVMSPGSAANVVSFAATLIVRLVMDIVSPGPRLAELVEVKRPCITKAPEVRFVAAW